MNDLLNFDFQQQPVRIILQDDEPWWIAADVAAILGYEHTPHMLRALDDDEKGVQNVDTLGGAQAMSIISESGLYSAIFRSRRAEARAFRRWVTGTVLPTLRRTGSFSMGPATPQLSRIDVLARKIGHRPHVSVMDATYAAGLPDNANGRAQAAAMLRALGWTRAYVPPETRLLPAPSAYGESEA